MVDLHGFCTGCGSRTYLDITDIEGSKKGYIISGKAICNNCGQFFEMKKNIDVDLKGLECPSCHKNNFDINFNTINKFEQGYEFSALLKCKARACNWKNNITSGIHSIRDIFAKIDSVELKKDGFKIKTRT